MTNDAGSPSLDAGSTAVQTAWGVGGLTLAWFAALYETSLLLSGIMSADGIVLDANRSSIEGCGLDRAETLGRPFWEGGWWSADAELSGQVRTLCERALASGDIVRATIDYFLGDGSRRMVELALVAVGGWGGQVYLVATGLDVTDALAAQRERERRGRQDARAAATRDLVDKLQRTLLAVPPEPDHLQIAVRYVAAREGARIGGDWYDVFLQPDGATMLVIGDVVGHDATAAAAMGELRSLLRALAWDSAGGPAEILTRMDHVAAGLQLPTQATLILARIERVPNVPGAPRTVRWSNAGHPPPVLLRLDGRAEILNADHGLMMGVDADTPRQDLTADLPDDSTLVMFTDGLVERRAMTPDIGQQRLCDKLADLGAAPLGVLCDTLLARMAPDGDDDVALLAVRMNREV